MIELGTLVRCHHDGDYGLVIDIVLDHDVPRVAYYEILWLQGTSGQHVASEFEVIGWK